MLNAIANVEAERLAHQPHVEHEWELPGWIPDKPAGVDYGFVANGNCIGCSPDELLSKVAERGVLEVKLVWTPETPQPTFPEKVPLLITAFKKRADKEAKSSIYWGAGFLAFGLILALASQSWEMLYRNIFSVLGAVMLAGGIWELASNRHYTQEDAQSAASSERFAAWIQSRAISVYTIAIAASIIIVGVAQLNTGEKESIEAAGLVKPAVWQGEVWRLFTCSLMHVNFTHFWMNFIALLHFAKIIDHTIHRAYVPIIFLLSAFCGSAFSLLLYPHTTSVGASGGLMGLLGFITVAAYIKKEKYPPKYQKRLIEGIGFVALLGIIGFAFIDNAAHLGGLCGGLLLGRIVFKLKNDKQRQKLEKLLPLLGILCLVLLSMITFACVWKFLK